MICWELVRLAVAARSPSGWTNWASPKSRILRRPSAGQSKIGRLQIAMDDALRVRSPQTLCELQTEAYYFVRGHRAGGELLVQRVPGDEFRDQESRCHRRYRNRGWSRCWDGSAWRETTLPGGIVCWHLVGQGAGRENFYCNVAFQLLVVRKKDHSHPARADLLHDAVVAEIFPEHVPEHNGMLSRREKRVNHHVGRRSQQEVPSPIISAIQICGSIKKC